MNSGRPRPAPRVRPPPARRDRRADRLIGDLGRHHPQPDHHSGKDDNLTHDPLVFVACGCDQITNRRNNALTGRPHARFSSRLVRTSSSQRLKLSLPYLTLQGLLPARLGAAGGRRGERIVGPGVARIAALHLGFDRCVAAAPEAGQVPGDLHWPMRRRQQLDDQRPSPAPPQSDAGRGRTAPAPGWRAWGRPRRRSRWAPKSPMGRRNASAPPPPAGGADSTAAARGAHRQALRR